MKKICISLLVVATVVLAKEPIGLWDFKLGMPSYEVESLFSKYRAENWEVHYEEMFLNLPHEPLAYDIPIKIGYTLLNNNKSLSLTFTEGLGGKLCNIFLLEKFNDDFSTRKQFNIIAEIMITKYGKPTKEYTRNSLRWIINKNQNVFVSTSSQPEYNSYRVQLQYNNLELLDQQHKYCKKEFQRLKKEYLKQHIDKY